MSVRPIVWLIEARGLASGRVTGAWPTATPAAMARHHAPRVNRERARIGTSSGLEVLYGEAGVGFMRKEGSGRRNVRRALVVGSSARPALTRVLERAEEQVRAPAVSVLDEEVRDVELRGALRHVEAARDLLIGEVVEHRLEHLAFPPGQALEAGGIHAQGHGAERGVDEAGEE